MAFQELPSLLKPILIGNFLPLPSEPSLTWPSGNRVGEVGEQREEPSITQ